MSKKKTTKPRVKKEPATIASVGLVLDYVSKPVGSPVGHRAKTTQQCPICDRPGWRKSDKQMVHRAQIVLTSRNESKLCVTSKCSLSIKNLEKAALRKASKDAQEVASP
jgi:hypothetical protein